MADKSDLEGLFSLELAVDKLNLKQVTCRFPAVAFRLLDFPTLIIYHVEPDLAQTIKEKICLDTSYKLAPQLQELQDKNGDFLVQRGKSCLFKISPQTLETHLSNTPLYVMVIDTYPDVPKLIGSCSIPMDAVMNCVMTDIDKQGLSVPSVHGEHGEYKVYNLMGYEIGNLCMGFRLLSLGMGLIPHIPNKAIAKFGKPTHAMIKGSNERNDTSDISEVADIMLRDIQAADKTIQVSLSAGVATECQLTQTAYQQLNTMAVQTNKRARIKERERKKRSKQREEPGDDFFVVNTVCPPPLFYNSEAPDPDAPTGLAFINRPTGGKTLDKYMYTEFGDTQCEDPLSFDIDDLSEEDTIRLEDNFDSDIEDNVDFKTSRIIRTEATRTTKSGTRKTFCTVNESHQTQHSLAVRTSSNVMPVLGNLTQFPMLNALMNEIMSLQGHGPSRQGRPVATNQSSPPPSTPSHYDHPSPRFSTPPASPATLARTKSEREAILARLATPRGSAATQTSGRKHSHRGCTETHDHKPRTSISSRRDSQLSVKKTKLAYGMTNTQRLRLAKVQPELLKQLEKEEAERVSKRRAEQKKEKSEPKLSGTDEPKSAANWPHLNGVSMYSSLEETGDMSVQTSSEWRKRPVPTPRKSIQMLKSTGLFSSELSESRPQTGLYTDSQWSGLDEYPAAEGSQASSAGSQSVQVHKPSVEQESVDSNATTTSRRASPIAYEEKGTFGMTRTLNKPGFPNELLQSRGSLVSRGSVVSRGSLKSRGSLGQYSDDFDLSHMTNSAEELGFQKVVEKYSDDTSEGSVNGMEPGLRKVVESYSASEEGSASIEEPALRRVVETYSDDDQYTAQLRKVAEQTSDHSQKSEDISYHSVESNYSDDEPRDQVPEPVSSNLHHKTSSRKIPLASGTAPVVAMRPTGFVGRDGMTTSSTLAATESFESTAYISRSQIPSDTHTSAESSSADTRITRVTQRPQPSPRRKPERVSSVHTESVSSYAPSDDISPGEPDEVGDDYSDAFDSDSDPPAVNKTMNDLRVDPRAKLGYTWT